MDGPEFARAELARLTQAHNEQLVNTNPAMAWVLDEITLTRRDLIVGSRVPVDLERSRRKALTKVNPDGVTAEITASSAALKPWHVEIWCDSVAQSSESDSR
jgi:hypothetical protein